VAFVAAVLCPVLAAAQTRQPPPTVKSPAVGRDMEITVGGVFLLPTPMGSQDINLIAPDGSPLTIATTTSKTAASFGAEARFGFRASNRWRFEITGGWSSVQFQTAVSGDAEAESVTASIGVSRFTAGGAATLRVAQKGKHEFYVLGGGSWMRELSELSAAGVYDDGAIIDGGGGFKMWWRERANGKVKRLGLRLEGRVGVRTGGLSLDDKSAHLVSTIVGSLIIGS